MLGLVRPRGDKQVMILDAYADDLRSLTGI
jgi:hypothetical protein